MVDRHAATKRHGQRLDGVPRTDFFGGKLARIGYVAEGVRLLTLFSRWIAVAGVPQGVEHSATRVSTWLGGHQPLRGVAGFEMCVGASVDGRKPCAGGVRRQAAGRCCEGTAPARGVHGQIRFVGQRMARA